MGFEYDREAAADASRAHVAYDAALSSYFAMAPEARSTESTMGSRIASHPAEHLHLRLACPKLQVVVLNK